MSKNPYGKGSASSLIIEFQSNISYQWDLIQCVEDAECRSQYKKKDQVNIKKVFLVLTVTIS